MEYNFLSRNCGLKVSAICLGGVHLQKNARDSVSFTPLKPLDSNLNFMESITGQECLNNSFQYKCFHIFQFWASAKLNKEDSFKILDRFVELGGNFIDTANACSEGQSEEVIGEWMKEYDNYVFHFLLLVNAGHQSTLFVDLTILHTISIKSFSNWTTHRLFDHTGHRTANNGIWMLKTSSD